MPDPSVRIIQLSPATLRALADGDVEGANASSDIALPAYFAGPDWRSTWLLRAGQVLEDPASADWVTGAIWDQRLELAVGQAGFHGPPDGGGTVEVGYAVQPEHRRKGYARATLRALISRAAADPAVRTVRASVSPDNEASLNLIAQFGFVPVGEQIDEEDGLELVFERPADLAT